jgi:peptidoglycan/LPS O-acetylase OafA/YrhL
MPQAQRRTAVRPHDRPLLDTIRWISAALVALGHALALIVSPTFTFQHAPLNALLVMLGNLRGGCVIIFFTLSGYLVGGSVLLNRDRFQWLSYAIARFSRIYIVLIPAIFLVVALDHLAWIINPQSSVYSSIWEPGALGGRTVFSTYHLSNYIATFAALPGIIAQPLGSGGPLWSLGHEWLFYFLFPALIAPLRPLPGWWPVVAVVVIVIFLMVLMHRAPTAAFFLIWTMGAAARVILEKRPAPKVVGNVGIALAAAAFLLGGLHPYRAIDILLGLGFAVFLAQQSPGERGLSRRLDSRLANASYSLYVTHLSVMAFITMMLERAGLVSRAGLYVRTADDLVTAIGLSAIMVIPAILIAWLYARLFEDNTDNLRRFLAQWFAPLPVAS